MNEVNSMKKNAIILAAGKSSRFAGRTGLIPLNLERLESLFLGLLQQIKHYN
jgi:molybdopterin-guanine dinucleotide biosynthesis protein A